MPRFRPSSSKTKVRELLSTRALSSSRGVSVSRAKKGCIRLVQSFVVRPILALHGHFDYRLDAKAALTNQWSTLARSRCFKMPTLEPSGGWIVSQLPTAQADGGSSNSDIEQGTPMDLNVMPVGRVHQPAGGVSASRPARVRHLQICGHLTLLVRQIA